MTTGKNKQDFIDEVIEEWSQELPDLDTKGMAVGARIFAMHRHMERRIDRYLAKYDLQIWGFDVLASLLRSGPPYTQTPTRLMRNCFLSSGAVTNRLNRLEKRGLILRKQAEEDKRSITVTLSEEGIELTREAVRGRVEDLQPLYSVFSEKERKELVPLLRKFLLKLEELEDWT